MQEAYQKLEGKRKLFFFLSLAALALEAGGAVGIILKHRPAGLAVALAGLALWIYCSLWAKRTYTRECARLRVAYGLPLENARFPGKEEPNPIAAPSRGLLPAALTADRPMFLHTACGRLMGRKADIAEVTLPYHEAGQQARRFLIGTALHIAAPGCRAGLMLLRGHPYGGTVRAEDFTGLRLLETGDAPYRALAAEDCDPTEAQRTAFETFLKGCTKDVILRTENDGLTLFLSRRFYSGHYSLSAPLKREALTVPLPELAGLNALLKGFGD